MRQLIDLFFFGEYGWVWLIATNVSAGAVSAFFYRYVAGGPCSLADDATEEELDTCRLIVLAGFVSWLFVLWAVALRLHEDYNVTAWRVKEARKRWRARKSSRHVHPMEDLRYLRKNAFM